MKAGLGDGVRVLALAALARMPSRRAIPAFERVLRERWRSTEARRIAISGLEGMRVRGAAALLRAVACDEQEASLVRGACVDALATMAMAEAA